MAKQIQGNLDPRQVKGAERMGESDVMLMFEAGLSPLVSPLTSWASPLIGPFRSPLVGEFIAGGPSGGAAPSGYFASSFQTATTLYETIGICIDGGGSVPTTGVKGYFPIPFAATIVGWSVIADQAGALTMDIDRKASSAPPSNPGVPNTTTDKISASAPIALGTLSPLVTAQSASSGAAGISTWTKSLAQWDTIGYNLTGVSTLTRVTIALILTRT